MMRRLTKDNRGRIAEKFMEMGNLTFLGLVVTQLLQQEKLNLQAVLAGVVVLTGAYYLAYHLMTGGGR